MGVKITKKNGEFYKIRNYSNSGKLKTIAYSDKYIEDLLYGNRKEDSPAKFKGITIKIK